jgi:hypothetical protein
MNTLFHPGIFLTCVQTLMQNNASTVVLLVLYLNDNDRFIKGAAETCIICCLEQLN